MTQSQVLEEQISIVESRIHELEQPKDKRTSVPLHNPYHHGHHRGSSQFEGLAPPPSTSHQVPNLAHQPRSMNFSLDLMRVFLRHAAQMGFFLGPQLSEALSSGAAPAQMVSPALLDTIYLWGAHLSRSSAHESSFLTDALRSTAASLSNAHSTNAVIHTIQAEVLLAQYFFRNARVLEGKYHASAAVSITLSSGLHKIRSADANSSRSTVDSLSPAATALEEGERINAFWAVVTLNNCWFTADGSPRDVSYALVDIPWPLNIEAYSEDSWLLPFQSSATIVNFLDNFPDRWTSLPALHAKAAIVFEQASRLAARFTENAVGQSPDAVCAEFSKLDGVIEGFKRTLPPLEPDSKDSLNLVIHTLAHAATIQLHNPFSLKPGGLRMRAASAAMAVVGLVRQTNLRAFDYIDAIVGTLWTAACQVLITELSHTRYSPGGAKNAQQFFEGVETLLTAMSVFSQDCRLIELQLATVQQNYAAVRNSR
ncbi:Zn(2)-Cys(6) binuclear cluster domain-containing protein [Mycena polygramma]|nr:Zn(2)-Cys(6) binuclear cluster domain-containing protein [Mycena polygramma]